MTRFIPKTGVGIQFDKDSLHAVCIRGFLNHVKLVDHLEISGFRQLEPQECGRLYREFLSRNGLKATRTVVALPRSMILLRSLQFPNSMKNDLPRALEIQLDSLHPFEEGSVYWDSILESKVVQGSWTGKGPAKNKLHTGQLDVLVTIAEKHSVDELAEWFLKAEIPVSQFTATTNLLLGMRRFLDSPPASPSEPGFLVCSREDGFELIGTAPGRPVLAKDVQYPQTGEIADADKITAIAEEMELALSELRLDPSECPNVLLASGDLRYDAPEGPAALSYRFVSIKQRTLPVFGVGNDLLLDQCFIGVGAAMAALYPRDFFGLNLLPVVRRSLQSSTAYVPTYALVSLAVLLTVALGLRGLVQDSLFSQYLQREEQALLPRVQKLDRVETENLEIFEKVNMLGSIDRSSHLPMELLDELTQILPGNSWLQSFQYQGNAVTLSGTADSAASVLQALARSSLLESPQFLSAITRTPAGKENFRIGVQLRSEGF